MEANLFWIGVGLGGYAALLRWMKPRTPLFENRAVQRILHLLLWAAIGSLVGFVFSASTELHGPTPKWPLVGAAGGALWALYEIWKKSRTGKPSSLLDEDYEWCETSYSAILLAAVIMYAVLQAFKIPSGSMEDTLRIGDHLFVNKFIYGVRIPYTAKRLPKVRPVRRGDVVVFEAPSAAITDPDEKARGVRKDFIKRAIGLPGDEIWVRNKKVFINGQPIDEPYAVWKDPYAAPVPRNLPPREVYQSLWEKGELNNKGKALVGDNFGPITVPPGHYFVMGDNRDYSFDSRFWGPLPDRLLKGKAWIVYWPFGRVKSIR